MLQVQPWNVEGTLKISEGMHGGRDGFVLRGKRVSEIISLHPPAQAPSSSSLPHVMELMPLPAILYWSLGERGLLCHRLSKIFVTSESPSHFS